MSRTRPLSPVDQKGYLGIAEICFTESLLLQLCNVIYTEHPQYKRDSSASPKALSTLVLQLQFVMDELLGKKTSVKERFAIKIPSLFFRDFAHPNGILKHMLVWALEFRHQFQQADPSHSSRRFELNSGKNKQFSIDLIQYLWRKLKEENMWLPPKIFFWGDFSKEDIETYSNMVTKLSGVVVDKAEDATHRVVSQTVIDPEDTEHYYRVLERRGFKAFVHWWYFPDSYDTWIGSASGGGGGGYQTNCCHKSNFKEAKVLLLPPNGTWTLSIEWLKESEWYNEWMNEGDFEMSQFQSSSSSDDHESSRTKPSCKRRSSTGTSMKPQKPWRRSMSTALQRKAGSADTHDTNLDEDLGKFSHQKKRRTAARANSAGREPGTSSSDVKKARSAHSLNGADTRSRKVKRMTLNESSDLGNVPSKDYIVTLTLSASTQTSDKAGYEQFDKCEVSYVSFPVISDDEDMVTASTLPQESSLFPNQKNACKDEVVDGLMITERSPPRVEDISVTDPDLSAQISPKEDCQKESRCVDNNGVSVRRMGESSENGTPAPRSQPSSVAPRVVQYPSRSLEHSICNANPRDLFERIHSLNPLDQESDSRILELKNSTGRVPNRRAEAAENALRTMVALWASSCEYPYVFGLNNTQDNESPDIPPVPMNEGDTSKKDSTVNGSLDHLSELERRVLEDASLKDTSEYIDMFEETGVTEKEASEIPITLPLLTEHWFSLDAVHTLERDHFDVWFLRGIHRQLHVSSVSPSPVTHVDIDAEDQSHLRQYKEIRNAIVLRYRFNPLRYLTVSHCRRFLDVDAGLLVAVHAFLDFWGIINFQALPHTRPSRSRRPLRMKLSKEEARTAQKEPNDKATQSVTNQQPTSVIPSVYCVVCKCLCLHSYYVLKPTLSSGVPPPFVQRAAWCLQCIAQGRFPEVLSQKQFVKVCIPLNFNINPLNEHERWSNDEVEKLIDGIELYGENWEAVANHVGTRTEFECVSFFLQLPLDDPQRTLPPSTGDKKLCTVFQNATNPLMTQLKFLTAIVGPQIGAQAAKSAYDALLGVYNKKEVTSSAETASKESSTTDKELERLVCEKLQQPVSKEDEKVAIEDALRTAASMAVQYAERENAKIRQLMFHLNHLKESNVKQKVLLFYTHEDLIKKKVEELEIKLKECVTARDELRASLMSSYKEHEKLFYDLQHQDKTHAVQPKFAPGPQPFQQFVGRDLADHVE